MLSTNPHSVLRGSHGIYKVLQRQEKQNKQREKKDFKNAENVVFASVDIFRDFVETMKPKK